MVDVALCSHSLNGNAFDFVKQSKFPLFPQTKMKDYTPTKKGISLFHLKEIGSGLIQIVNRFFSSSPIPLQQGNEALSIRTKGLLQYNVRWEGYH